MSKVKVTGLSNFKKSMQVLGDSFEDAVSQGVAVTAQKIRTDAIKGIQTESFGSHVRRSKQGGGGTYAHIAAKPGEAPNSDTGNLVSSIQVEEVDKTTFKVGATSKAEYAGHLEFGTTKMAARPWLQPALEQNKGQLMKNIKKTVRMAVNQAKKASAQ